MSDIEFKQLCCDVSTKLKNLKATHNEGMGDEAVYNAVMYPQS